MARSPAKSSAAEAPLFDHLEELRTRILIALVFWGVGSAVGWAYRTQLLEWLKAPLYGTHLYQAGKLQLISQNITDQLLMSFSIAFWAGLALALPFILHQVWLFVAPGLYSHERRWAAPFVLGAGLSFLLGALFAYFVLLPPMFQFLVDFLGGVVNGYFPIAGYVSQVVTILVAFGLIFELPILAFVLTKIGIVNARMLGGLRRYAFVVILILAAIITPTTDPFNLALVAAPIYLLYEIGILVSRLAAPRPRDLVAAEE